MPDSLKVPKDSLNSHPEGNRNLANSTVKSDNSLRKCAIFLTLVHRLKHKVKRDDTSFEQLLCSSVSESQNPYYAPLARGHVRASHMGSESQHQKSLIRVPL